jgi:hypothetical protein
MVLPGSLLSVISPAIFSLMAFSTTASPALDDSGGFFQAGG